MIHAPRNCFNENDFLLERSAMFPIDLSNANPHCNLNRASRTAMFFYKKKNKAPSSGNTKHTSPLVFSTAFSLKYNKISKIIYKYLPLNTWSCTRCCSTLRSEMHYQKGTNDRPTVISKSICYSADRRKYLLYSYFPFHDLNHFINICYIKFTDMSIAIPIL